MAYEPNAYWSDRLTADFDLRGTGHLSYTAEYNQWLYRQKARALDRALPAGDGLALDVGSGTGWVVNHLLGRGYLVEGCDITAVAVERLARTFPGTFFRLQLGQEPIPRADASFDVVTMVDVAYHIVDDDQWRSALSEMGRVLRSGGRLIASDGLGSSTLVEAEHVRKRSLPEWESAARHVCLRLEAVTPLFRWLSRPRDLRGWKRLSDGLRGRVEYTLERLPTEPHMRIATFVKR